VRGEGFRRKQGRIPKRPKGPDCKSGGVCLHRFESCFSQWFCSSFSGV
jgi:hypothetical protein